MMKQKLNAEATTYFGMSRRAPRRASVDGHAGATRSRADEHGSSQWSTRRWAGARNGGSRSRRSRTVGRVLAIDHVIVVVHDLDAAARRFDEQHGLASVAGGRHAGHGTGNRIVPLGSSYIELMAVVDPDEAAFSPLGAWLARRLVEVVGGITPAALCLRTDDIEAAARRTGASRSRCVAPVPTASSSHGTWSPDAALTDGLPFFIQWHVDDADHPGHAVAEHRCAANGIAWWSWAAIPIDSRRGWASTTFPATRRGAAGHTGSPSRSPSARPSSSAEGRDLLAVRHHAARARFR